MTRAVTPPLDDSPVMRFLPRRRPTRLLCHACGCEQTDTDRAAGACTQCDTLVIAADILRTEHALAQLTVALLKDGGMTDADILKDYARERPAADRVYEREYFKEFGVRIAADRVKVEMRRLLRH